MTGVTKNNPNILEAATAPILKPAAKRPWAIGGLTLITGATAEPEALPDGAVVIQDGKILDIGATAVVQARHPQLNWHDGRGFTAFPGLVNAHTHAAMGFFRGLGHGRDQMIESFLFPAERSLTAELLEPLSYSYLLAGLRTGTTCFGEHYYFVEGIARAMERLGVRGVVGETCADLGGAFPSGDTFTTWCQQIDRWSFSERVTPAIAPHAADTVSATYLTAMANFAKQRQLPLHMHLSQTTGERQRVEQRERCSPVSYAAKAGALTDRTLAVHLVAVDDADLKLLKSHGVTVGACPASQIIYERLAPIEKFHAHKIPVALGTDCAASNDGADILSEMKLAALLSRDRQTQYQETSVDHFSPAAVLTQATQNGAQALGLGGKIGQLKIGMAADIVFAEQTLDFEPFQRPLTNLIYSTGSRDIRHVMIAGQFVLWQGEPTLVSAADLRQAYRTSVQEIQRRLALQR